MSRLYAWCWGATTGYVAGWLAGSAVRDRAEARRLGRPETRASVHRSPLGGLAGSQAVEGRPRLEAALSGHCVEPTCIRPNGHEGWHMPDSPLDVPWDDDDSEVDA